jgi:choline dehydrogenase-like flavoprotein
MTDRPAFNYIIVGGGTAGKCLEIFLRRSVLNIELGFVLASRLSNYLPSKSILIIEAGPERDPRVEPALGLLVSDPSNILWNHRSVPQPELRGKTVGQPQGKILGGSSAVNYQTWTRGAAAEFDLWAEEVGDPRWSWKGMLPYFKRTESFIPGRDMRKDTDFKVHGRDGPITVNTNSFLKGVLN